MPGPLEERLIALGFEQRWFDEAHERDIEDLAHAMMREMAIRHLASSPSPRAKDYRDSLGATLQAELDSQSQPKTWSDEQHLIALAETIGCNAQVREHSQPEHVKPIHQEVTVLAPTLDLCHIGENHWIRSSHHSEDQAYYTTNPDGNCLYRAAAQDLHRLVQDERLALSNTSNANSSRTTRENSRANSPSSQRRSLMNNNTPTPPWQNAILAQAGNFKAALSHLSQQDFNTLEADYRSYRTPCSNGTSLNSTPKVTDLTEQVHRDHLLALRLQLEEIEQYHKSCAPQ